MLRQRLSQLQDEEGSSMIEVMVGLAMGMVVLAGLSMLLIVTLHGNARVEARVEASDNARVAMTRIIEELHSACVQPTVAPIQTGSTNTMLIFKHGPYGQQAGGSQGVTTTTIAYSGIEKTLREHDVTSSGESDQLLLSNVGLPASEKVFEYKNPTTSVQEASGESPPAKTILVNVAFTANPKSEPVSDAGASTEIHNSATLRLTPPLYSSTKEALPCQ